VSFYDEDMWNGNRFFGVGGKVRWGAPGAEESVYKSMAAYRAGTGQHWVKLRGDDIVLRPCRRPLNEECRWCADPNTNDHTWCRRCVNRPQPCRACRKWDAERRDKDRAAAADRHARDTALGDWLADPHRRLPETWNHPVAPSDPMWRYDVWRGEHVYTGTGVTYRKIRQGPCPPGRECPQCLHGLEVLHLTQT